ncbi:MULTISPECIES: hypothetical protein [Pseudomonas]|uniref:Uncharacterized protein n=1 Tax=Pseudomonas koreensis TaxID=198620 RepID=A0AA94EIW8_9PSED|nr:MULTISPECIES: hypothetical protein [Pseudomonas]RVD74449.1 hypothetical protein A9HBioS_5689 [Pseudomonas koreensis]
MNRLTITQHKSKYSAGHYPTFAIDELPLEVWLPHHNPQAELHLVAAHSGLYSDQENELIWDRAYSTAPGWTTLLPLLVCSDDLDLSCSVIVTEQFSDETVIHWQRFGLLKDRITSENPEVDWFHSIPSVTFARAAFINVLDSFREIDGVKVDWD